MVVPAISTGNRFVTLQDHLEEPDNLDVLEQSVVYTTLDVSPAVSPTEQAVAPSVRRTPVVQNVSRSSLIPLLWHQRGSFLLQLHLARRKVLRPSSPLASFFPMRPAVKSGTLVVFLPLLLGHQSPPALLPCHLYVVWTRKSSPHFCLLGFECLFQ